ncbi:CubicO group peptidase (beta-lactamase class C family) [Pseudoxanthomonas japonensis]|uniref:serine hydrolase domain-containing protein n=1 Tax=Pseudoxanthomonas japonensis TaxID=69284 RepID=UPI002864465C|nr:serine hydrolase domain-containing protein [Pseudoxanthomonas japonensis]MDR7069898.1 CubicO group peptidase (beta-lactamase class C family) [Pseudoxanthomonas japonensis]
MTASLHTVSRHAASFGRRHGLWMAGGLVLAASVTLVASPVAASPVHVSTPRQTMPASLDAFLDGVVGDDAYLGAVAVVSSKGRIVYRKAAGHADLQGAPLREDAIFRIYSMTKPVTSVAALMLVEEGRLRLDDPVARYLPAFAALDRVTGDADEGRRVPVQRALTVRHLLTHTAGFATGGDDIRAASALLQAQAPEEAADLAGYADRVARAPLVQEPGTRFRYDGVNTEVLARVIEVASGQSLGDFLRSRIFIPLRMPDTGFEVPAAQRGRVMALTRRDGHGRRVLAETPSARTPGVRLRAYDSGAGGLYATAADYLRFAQMLANGGALDGVRLLRTASVDQMMRDQLAQFDPVVAYPEPGEGFGLGGYVVTDPATSTRPGSKGQFGWSGAAGTYFTIDRPRGLVILLLSQHLPTDEAPPLPKLATPFYRAVYAVVSP